MKSSTLSRIFSAVLLSAIFSPLFAQAQYQDQGQPQYQDQGQPQYQGQQQGDPPTRAARLTYEHGAVSLQTSGADQWTDAGKNYPLTSGDRIYVDNGGRAEIQAGQTAIRLSSGTDLTITNLTDQLTQFGLAQGTVRLRTYGIDPQATVELDTPNGAITVVRPGDIRVGSFNDGSTVVTVNTGAVQVSGPSLSQEIAPGQSVRLTGDNPVQLINVAMPGYDDFDRFSIDRDKRILNSQSARYVSRDVVGYDDLDDNGSWNNTQDAGPVWYPNNVPQGWAPYQDGRWAYVQPWGWTWVDNASWGFAPFHYGRWSNYGNRWGWVPGPVAVVPVYSPALVVFIGGIGLGFGGGYGDGGYGGGYGGGGLSAWFPLGVGEPYVPWYRCSPSYVRQVNVTNINVTNIHNTTVVNNYNNFINNTRNVTNVNNINTANIQYAHRQNGVTAVNARDFAAGRPVAQSIVKVDPVRLRQATVVRQGPAAVQPTQAALVRPVTHAAPPVALARPTVLTKEGPRVAMPNAPRITTAPARLGEALPRQQNQPGQQPVQQQNRAGQQPGPVNGSRPGQGAVTQSGQPVVRQPGVQQNGQQNHIGQPIPTPAARPGQVQPGQPAQPVRPTLGAQPVSPAPGNNNATRPLITRTPPPATATPNGNRIPPPNQNNAPANTVQNNGQRPLPQNQRTVPAPEVQRQPTPATPQSEVRPQNQARPQYQPPQPRPAPPQNQRTVPAPEGSNPPTQQNQVRPAPAVRPQPQAEPRVTQERSQPQPQQRPAPEPRVTQERPQPPPQQRPAPEPRVTQERPQPPPPPQAYSRPAPQPQYRPAPELRPAPQQAQQVRPQPQYRPAPEQRPVPQQAQQVRPQPQQRPPPEQHPAKETQQENQRHDGRPTGR